MKKKSFVNIRVKIYEENCDFAYGILNDFPFLGAEEKLDEIMVCFDASLFNDAMRDDFISRLKEIAPETELIETLLVEDENWNEAWESSIEPIIISDNISIAPEWKKGTTNRKYEVIINPKMSFGTGHHATTRLVSKMLESAVKPDTFWIDAGCGTAALAILAKMLGAKSVYAFDYDEWSVENSIENVELNKCSGSITVEQADIKTIDLPKCDAIAANLFRHLLIEAFPKFYASLKDSKGDLLISGILSLDAEEVLNQAKKAGFEIFKIETEDEWTAAWLKISS